MYKFLICALAGIGAGIATGFAGLSAAVFISPMLVTFLDVPTYDAIGIALASDVLACIMSALYFRKKGNIDVKNGKSLISSVLIFSVVGSVVSYFVTLSEFGNSAMGNWTIIAAFLLGIKFIFWPIRESRLATQSKKKYKALAALCGMGIGFVCGFQGTGGGMAMLFALTIVMGYEFKKAVGTSIFIMAFTAFIGAAAHFAIGGVPDKMILLVCSLFTLVSAQIASRVANKISVVSLNRATGVLLTISGIIMFITNIK